MPLYTVVGFISAALTYVILAQDKILYKVMLMIASFILFLHTYVAYMNRQYDHDFVELHNSQTNVNEAEKRFIYLMFPNLVSPSYFSTEPSVEALKTQKIMQGFFAKNQFRNYQKAYTPENHYLKNMVKSMNPRSEKSIMAHLLNTRLLTEYWRFYNLSNDYIFLKNNEIYDIFHRNGFQISAYKTRDFDMCHKNHKYNVNRCVEKINHPINVFDVDLPISSRVNILLVEWLDSMRLFGDLTKIYNFFQTFFNLDDVPMLGISYNNLYVVNSVKTFDILLKDMQQDSGKQAYIALIDLPSDMYVYDEFCHIKPRDRWLNMKNLPWVRHDYAAEKQEAYLQQTRCLFGRLEQFIDQLKSADIWENSVIIIQGVSGVNHFHNQPISDAKEDFIGNHLVTMAIHDSNMPKGEQNKELCATTSILSEYLFRDAKCKTEKPIMHESVMAAINSKLDEISSDRDQQDQETFVEWYEQWLAAQNPDSLILNSDEDMVYTAENTEKEDFGLENPESQINLNEEVFELKSQHGSE